MKESIDKVTKTEASVDSKSEPIMGKKSDNLKYILTRYDNYINASNVKGTFIVSLNTFIVGCIIINRKTLIDIFLNNESLKTSINVLIYLVCILALVIIGLTIVALFPYLKSGNSSKDSYHSHIYYGSVKGFQSADDYIKSFEKLDDDSFKRDLANQVWVVAKGVSIKYQFLNYSMIVIFFELFLFLIILCLILFQ